MTDQPAGDARRAIVSVLRGGGPTPAGVGFLVGDHAVVTCAHVVNAALGRDPRQQDRPEPDARVDLEFALLGDAEGAPRRRARVTAWLPPPRTGLAGGDVAGLVLVGEGAPAGSAAVRLAEAEPADGWVEVFGYPPRPARPAGAWTRCRLLGRVGGGLLQLDQDSASALRVQPGYSGSPLWDPARRAALGMLAVASPDGGVGDAYAIPADLLAAAWPEVLTPVPPCPYPGLAPLGEEPGKPFVGREAETGTLLQAVERNPVVALVGPSGVGKSSLVAAGLVPALRSRGWAVASFRPGAQPFEALAVALLRLELPGPTVVGVDQIGRRAGDLAERGVAAVAQTLSLSLDQPILLVADQFEELFAEGVAPDVRDRFLDAVLPAADQAAAGPWRLVLTLRADFLPPLLSHPDAGPRLQGRDVLLSPMTEATLQRVIREPARQAG